MKRILVGLAFAAGASGCAISTQQEVQMGTEYAQQINSQLPIVKDPEVQRYINVLGDSIAKLADDRSLGWQFFVVNANEVNAFAACQDAVQRANEHLEKVGKRIKPNADDEFA